MKDEIITSVVESVAGPDVLPLIEVLKGKKNVSEFTIAEELKEEINTIRNKLYRLYDSNLVEFTRKKDKKKGWYIYYWTFVPSRALPLLKEMKRKRLDKIKQKLNSEQAGHFYICENGCTRQTFEQAMDHEFKCGECGSLMNQEDNAKKISQLLREIEDLEDEIKNMPDIIVQHHEPELELIDDEKQEIKRIPKIKEIHTLKQKIAVKTKPQKKPDVVKRKKSVLKKIIKSKGKRR
ncbi:hypothetical protein JXB27_03980 [Candidatus Woesearchaeota archaeon]|nr:hypothetical protein [Candidatus Woesearchaeota archaeon]